MRELAARVRAEAAKAVVGLDATVDLLVGTLVLGGHALLEGPPGTAKTLMGAAVSRALDLEFRRVQFTPDMLPSDLTGTMTLRGGELAFRPGPVFTNVLLADEINRTPPKTQAALLEAMGEGQVSVDGVARVLDEPFLVIATQNPIEFEGTYPLPEAQLDRFLMRLDIGYPSVEDERAMLRLPRRGVGAAGARWAGTGRRCRGAGRGPGTGRRDDGVRRRAGLRERRGARDADAAVGGAGRVAARGRAPGRRRTRRGAAGGPRLRHARRRRCRRHARPRPPAGARAGGRARALRHRRRHPRRAGRGAGPAVSSTIRVVGSPSAAARSPR